MVWRVLCTKSLSPASFSCGKEMAWILVWWCEQECSNRNWGVYLCFISILHMGTGIQQTRIDVRCEGRIWWYTVSWHLLASRHPCSEDFEFVNCLVTPVNKSTKWFIPFVTRLQPHFHSPVTIQHHLSHQKTCSYRMSHFPTFTFLGLSLFRGSITLSDNHQPTSRARASSSSWSSSSASWMQKIGGPVG